MKKSRNLVFEILPYVFMIALCLFKITDTAFRSILMSLLAGIAGGGCIQIVAGWLGWIIDDMRNLIRLGPKAWKYKEEDDDELIEEAEELLNEPILPMRVKIHTVIACIAAFLLFEMMAHGV